MCAHQNKKPNVSLSNRINPNYIMESKYTKHANTETRTNTEKHAHTQLEASTCLKLKTSQRALNL